MSNPENSLRPVSMRILVPNESQDQLVEIYSKVVVDYWLEGVIYDPNRFLFRQGTVVELFISARKRRDLDPIEVLSPEGQKVRNEMEHALLDLKFDED